MSFQFFLLPDCVVSATPPNVVTTEVSAPAGIPVTPEEATLALTEGVAKGGYPVDIGAQSTVDLTSAGQSEPGCLGALAESGLEPAAVAQLEMGYKVLDTQQSYNEEQDFPPSITEVIRPMEMAELVDILPTLSLMEEDTPSGPCTPSVMDMLESFGLGICENTTYFHLENSGLENIAECEPEPSSLMETDCEEETACPAKVEAAGGDGDRQVHNQGGGERRVRNQVEWDRPSNASS